MGSAHGKHPAWQALGFVLCLACGRVAHQPGADLGDESPAGAAGEVMGGEEPSTGGKPATDAGGMPSAPGGQATAGAPNPAEPEPLLPWQTGNSWTYRITESDVVTEKTTTVGALELVGGSGPHAMLHAYLVTTNETNGDHTESWQGPAEHPERIVRYREVDYDAGTGQLEMVSDYVPHKLHVDGSPEHSLRDATWLEEHEEMTQEVGLPLATSVVLDRWYVVADDEELTVPAGTFMGVVHIVRTRAFGEKHYWYARGVGKLREEGLQIEELVDYHLEH